MNKLLLFVVALLAVAAVAVANEPAAGAAAPAPAVENNGAEAAESAQANLEKEEKEVGDSAEKELDGEKKDEKDQEPDVGMFKKGANMKNVLQTLDDLRGGVATMETLMADIKQRVLAMRQTMKFIQGDLLAVEKQGMATDQYLHAQADQLEALTDTITAYFDNGIANPMIGTDAYQNTAVHISNYLATTWRVAYGELVQRVAASGASAPPAAAPAAEKAEAPAVEEAKEAAAPGS